MKKIKKIFVASILVVSIFANNMVASATQLWTDPTYKIITPEEYAEAELIGKQGMTAKGAIGMIGGFVAGALQVKLIIDEWDTFVDSMVDVGDGVADWFDRLVHDPLGIGNFQNIMTGKTLDQAVTDGDSVDWDEYIMPTDNQYRMHFTKQDVDEIKEDIKDYANVTEVEVTDYSVGGLIQLLINRHQHAWGGDNNKGFFNVEFKNMDIYNDLTNHKYIYAIYNSYYGTIGIYAWDYANDDTIFFVRESTTGNRVRIANTTSKTSTVKYYEINLRTITNIYGTVPDDGYGTGRLINNAYDIPSTVSAGVAYFYVGSMSPADNVLIFNEMDWITNKDMLIWDNITSSLTGMVVPHHGYGDNIYQSGYDYDYDISNGFSININDYLQKEMEKAVKFDNMNNTDQIVEIVKNADDNARNNYDTVTDAPIEFNNSSGDDTSDFVDGLDDSIDNINNIEGGFTDNFNTSWDNLDLNFSLPDNVMTGITFIQYMFTGMWNGQGDYIKVAKYCITIGLVAMLIGRGLPRIIPSDNKSSPSKKNNGGGKSKK